MPLLVGLQNFKMVDSKNGNPRVLFLAPGGLGMGSIPMQFLFEMVEWLDTADLLAQGVNPPGEGGGAGAEGAVEGGEDEKGGGGFLGGMLPFMLMMLAVVVIMTLFSGRPQRKEQAKRQEMLEKLQKNDRILTAGGIVGTVANIDKEKDMVTLRIDEANNVKIKMVRSSIARVLTDEDKKGIEKES